MSHIFSESLLPHTWYIATQSLTSIDLPGYLSSWSLKIKSYSFFSNFFKFFSHIEGRLSSHFHTINSIPQNCLLSCKITFLRREKTLIERSLIIAKDDIAYCLAHSFSAFAFLVKLNWEFVTLNFGHVNRFPVQESASSFSSREQFLENRIVHDTEDHLLLDG